MPGLELVLAQTQELTIPSVQDACEGVGQLSWTAPAEVHLPGIVRVRGNTASHVRCLKPVEWAANREARLRFIAHELLEGHPRYVLHQIGVWSDPGCTKV